MAEPRWMSLRAYARHRGVTLSAVQKAIESRRVTAIREDAGRITGIDQVQADAQWALHTDPVQAMRSGAPIGAIAEPGAQLDLANAGATATEKRAGETGDALPAAEKGADPHGYLAERAKREKFTAAQAELEYLEAIGRLVPADEIRESTARRYRAIRDKLLNIPDRIAAIVAAEKEPARVHAALSAEIKRVLHELSDDAVAEAARGAEERVAA